MAPTRAAKSPADPMLRALLRAPFWELPEEVPGEVEGREEEVEEELVVGRGGVGVVVGLGGFGLVVNGGVVTGVVLVDGIEDTVLLLEGCEGREEGGGTEPVPEEAEQPGAGGGGLECVKLWKCILLTAGLDGERRRLGSGPTLVTE